MHGQLTRYQRMLYTFQGQKVDKLCYCPRLYYWYAKNKQQIHSRQKLAEYLKSVTVEIPHIYRNKTQMQIYDQLGAAPRYCIETLGIPLTSYYQVPDFFRSRFKFSKRNTGESITKLVTHKGTLIQIQNPIGVGMSGTIKEYYVKEIDDLKIIQYYLDHSKHLIFPSFIRYATIKLGDRGVISTYMPRSPYQRCILDLIGFVRTTVFLKRYPREMEQFMNFLMHFEEDFYKKLAKTAIPIINFGENIDSRLTPPKLFERYCLPYYEKYVKILHQGGKFCHIHMDGNLKDLLPYFDYLPFDGLEALSPKPLGDVTITELREALGNKILLDGIPSNIFLPQFSMDYAKEITEQVLKAFSPRIIVGISDELPPNGEIRKVEMIADMIENFYPYD